LKDLVRREIIMRYDFTDKAGDRVELTTDNRALIITTLGSPVIDLRTQKCIMVELPEEEARRLKAWLNENYP
jgi:hypothetical protein